jgi:hypothetical protein
MRLLCFKFGDDIVEYWSLLINVANCSRGLTPMRVVRRCKVARYAKKRIIQVISSFDRIRYVFRYY